MPIAMKRVVAELALDGRLYASVDDIRDRIVITDGVSEVGSISRREIDDNKAQKTADRIVKEFKNAQKENAPG